MFRQEKIFRLPQVKIRVQSWSQVSHNVSWLRVCCYSAVRKVRDVAFVKLCQLLVRSNLFTGFADFLRLLKLKNIGFPNHQQNFMCTTFLNIKKLNVVSTSSGFNIAEHRLIRTLVLDRRGKFSNPSEFYSIFFAPFPEMVTSNKQVTVEDSFYVLQRNALRKFNSLHWG